MSAGNFAERSNQLVSFLQEEGFDFKQADRPAQVRAFQKAMREGLARPAGDMLMIPTWLTVPRGDLASAAAAENIIVLDIGGSNIRVGRAKLAENGRVHLEIATRFPMPGKGEVCSKEAFLAAVVDRVEPLWTPGCRIGLCFSYEMDMRPDHDGRIVRFSKEVLLPELEGELLGQALLAELAERGLAETGRIVLLNDTVAALLGGLSAGRGRQHESYIGLIIGTGTNTAYVEQTDNIGKIRTEPALREGRYTAKHMIINMEAGGYRTEFRTSIDKALDRDSARPDHHRFEKMISGQYLGEIVYRLALRAAEAGILPQTLGRQLTQRGGLSTEAVDAMLWAEGYGAASCGRANGSGSAAGAGGMISSSTETSISGKDTAGGPAGKKSGWPADFEFVGEESRAILCELAAAVFHRAAWLTAIQLEGILRQAQIGGHRDRPVLCTVEGTTYSKSALYKKALAAEVDEHLTQKGLYLDLIEVADSNLTGSAIAALATE